MRRDRRFDEVPAELKVKAESDAEEKEKIDNLGDG